MKPDLGKPDFGHAVEGILLKILDASRKTNDLLIVTEKGNERRHNEVLEAIKQDPIIRSMVWVKKRREKIG